jgi:Flp pilus assembly protein TadG
MEAPLLVAYYWDGSVPMSHEIRNISATGFYLLTRERWHPGTVVTMTLQRTAGEKESSDAERYISVMSKVVRLGEDGVGFSFVPLEAKGSDSTNVPRNKPVDKRALGRFLEQLGLDRGCVVIGLSRGDREKETLGQDASSAMPGGSVMKRLNDESGQALIITALCMTCLFGFIALAADAGIMLREKRMAQTAADGAAVAGASELAYGAAAVSTAANHAAKLNGFDGTVSGITVTVNGPTGPSTGGPAYGPHANNPKYVEVIVSQVQPTMFMRFFGVLNMTPTARAVATQGVTNGCIVTMGTSGIDLSVIGNADITVATCGIADNSSASNALYLQGNATLTANSIGIAGGYQETGGSVNLTPTTPSTGMIPVSDPLAAKLGTAPAATGCNDVPASALSGATQLGPGCWNAFTVGSNNTLTLTGGQYVINGDINLSGHGTLDGSAGVELVLYGGINMGGNTNLKLSPSSPGGVVLWEPAPQTSALNLQGNPGSDIEGILYAPTAPVSLQGNAGAIIKLNFVVKSLALQGNASLLDYNQVNPNNLLTTARLVE